MGHYDTCRPENCSRCGQAKGYCEHTRPRRKKVAKKKASKCMRKWTDAGYRRKGKKSQQFDWCSCCGVLKVTTYVGNEKPTIRYRRPK